MTLARDCRPLGHGGQAKVRDRRADRGAGAFRYGPAKAPCQTVDARDKQGAISSSLTQAAMQQYRWTNRGPQSIVAALREITESPKVHDGRCFRCTAARQGRRRAAHAGLNLDSALGEPFPFARVADAA